MENLCPGVHLWTNYDQLTFLSASPSIEMQKVLLTLPQSGCREGGLVFRYPQAQTVHESDLSVLHIPGSPLNPGVLPEGITCSFIHLLIRSVLPTCPPSFIECLESMGKSIKV